MNVSMSATRLGWAPFALLGLLAGCEPAPPKPPAPPPAAVKPVPAADAKPTPSVKPVAGTTATPPVAVPAAAKPGAAPQPVAEQKPQAPAGGEAKPAAKAEAKHDHEHGDHAHPETFAAGIAALEKTVAAVKDHLVAAGKDAADDAVHDVAHLIEDMQGLLDKEKFAAEAKTVASKALDELFECFDKIDVALHAAEGKGEPPADVHKAHAERIAAAIAALKSTAKADTKPAPKSEPKPAAAAPKPEAKPAAEDKKPEPKPTAETPKPKPAAADKKPEGKPAAPEQKPAAAGVDETEAIIRAAKEREAKR